MRITRVPRACWKEESARLRRIATVHRPTAGRTTSAKRRMTKRVPTSIPRGYGEARLAHLEGH
jgi:hypothetical protein